MSTVSIHIVTYNSAAYIDQCLEAVFLQNHSIAQVIIVDNASKDGTLGKLERWADKCTIVRNAKNNGFAGGHNQAIRLTESDYCLVLNPDVALEPDYVHHLVSLLSQHRELGSATGKLLFQANPHLVDSAGLVINKARRAFDRGANKPSEAYQEAEEVFGVSGAAAMYARRMIDDISVNDEFFDEDFFAYKEDVDVAWRAQLGGWKAYFEPAAIGYHERGWKEGGRSSKPLFVRRWSYINRYKMIFKNDRFLYAIKHILPLLFYEVLSLAYAVLREPKLLGAWASFLGNLASLKAKRRTIQSKRRANLYDVYKWFQ
ncbi:glycosyltransferase family 2 protein [Paenibacillus aestuarii]|uniref:Glycosyltransferase family 2 protein n=1 Tax=Paenibacillus aestuarii TaxID=516965 RepID=A0ABW0K103_9BACL|nr:glycosyltransferase family 2 protein [Paenibacillus aestuarii]